MGQLAYETALTEAEYIAFEEKSDTRHEYVAGYVFAMGGGSKAHNVIAVNLIAGLKQELKGKPCQIFMSDVRVRVEKAQAYYYPDVVVSCDATDIKADAGLFVERPALIVEVQSLSTAKTDEREKWQAYRTLDSLQEYVLIDSRCLRATIHRRAQVGWVRVDLDAGDYFNLESVGYSVPLRELYAGVVLPESLPEE